MITGFTVFTSLHFTRPYVKRMWIVGADRIGVGCDRGEGFKCGRRVGAMAMVWEWSLGSFGAVQRSRPERRVGIRGFGAGVILCIVVLHSALVASVT